MRKAGNVYRVCSEIFAAGLMPPKLLAAGSDGGFTREFLEEGFDVAIELEYVTISVRQGSGWEEEAHLTPIEQTLEVDSANANLANFLIYLEACGMEWKTRLGIVRLGKRPLARCLGVLVQIRTYTIL